MFSKFPLFKIALLLMLVLVVGSITFGTLAFADGGIDLPFPPTENLPQGSSTGDFLVVTLLTFLQLIL
jgi:hypothetical protein